MTKINTQKKAESVRLQSFRTRNQENLHICLCKHVCIRVSVRNLLEGRKTPLPLYIVENMSGLFAFARFPAPFSSRLFPSAVER